MLTYCVHHFYDEAHGLNETRNTYCAAADNGMR